MIDWLAFEMSIGFWPFRWSLDLYFDHYWISVAFGPFQLTAGWPNKVYVEQV